MSTTNPLSLAEGYAMQALSLTPSENDGAVPESDLDSAQPRDVLNLLVSQADMVGLGFNIPWGLQVSLEVALDWLEEPVAREQDAIHRVTGGRLTEDPGTTVGTLGGTTIDGHLTRSLPTSYDLVRVQVEMSREQSDILDDFIYYEDMELGRPLHQFLGFQHPVQGDVWDSMKSHLTHAGGWDALQRLETIEHRILLQLEEDPPCGLQIADCGRLYILIPAQDLAIPRFDRTLACVQTS